MDLLFGSFGRTRIINDEIGSLDLFSVRNLGGHAPRDFRASGVFRDAEAARETLDALFGMACDHDETVEAVRGAGFEDEGGFHNSDAIRIARSDLIHPSVFVCDHGRVDDSIELLHTREARAPDRWTQRRVMFSGGGSEGSFREFGPADGPVRVEDRRPEAPNNFFIDGAPRLHEFVRNGVGLDEMGPEFYEHLADRRFAARYAAGQAEFEQEDVTFSRNEFNMREEARLQIVCSAGVPPAVAGASRPRPDEDGQSAIGNLRAFRPQ